MADRARIDAVELELIEGDITRQDDVAAVVNAANAMLMPGGGVAGAIHRAAGAGLAEECRALAPIAPGEAVMTGGHGLPNEYVIHCLGPVYGVDEPGNELLASCYARALALAEERRLESIAFPALSTGAFGYPLEEAAEVALRTVADGAHGLGHVGLVRFVLFGEAALGAHERALERVTAHDR